MIMTTSVINKSMSSEQHQQIIRTSIEWSGCATYSYVHMPMRAIIGLGSLKVAALIDTGSDYDAIDSDLSAIQEKRGNPAFRNRIRSSDSVWGFYKCFESIERYGTDLVQYFEDLEEGKFIQQSLGRIRDNICYLYWMVTQK